MSAEKELIALFNDEETEGYTPKLGVYGPKGKYLFEIDSLVFKESDTIPGGRALVGTATMLRGFSGEAAKRDEGSLFSIYIDFKFKKSAMGRIKQLMETAYAAKGEEFDAQKFVDATKPNQPLNGVILCGNGWSDEGKVFTKTKYSVPTEAQLAALEAKESEEVDEFSLDD